jgi:hypothetical protein
VLQFGWLFSQVGKHFSSKTGRYSTTKPDRSSKRVRKCGGMTNTYYIENNCSAG